MTVYIFCRQKARKSGAISVLQERTELMRKLQVAMDENGVTGSEDTRTFNAENHRMSVQKVSAILAVPLPADWQQSVNQMRSIWN